MRFINGKRNSKMKGRLLALIFFGISMTTFSACSDDDEITLFEIPYQVSFNINAGLDPFQVQYFQIDNLDNRLQDLLSSRGLSMSDVSKIAPGNAQMRAEFSNASYSFIREISVRLYQGDPQNPSNWKELFYRDDPNLFQEDSILDLFPSLVDALPLMQEETINLSIVIQLRDITPQTMEHQLNFSLFVQ